MTQHRYSVILILAVLLGACTDTTQDSPSRSEELSTASSTNSTAISMVEQRIQPSDTGTGIDVESVPQFYHHAVLPQRPEQRKNVLILHLVGSAVAPQSALDISRFAAGLGYTVLNLRYANKAVVDLVCGERIDCPEQFRGETVFGESVRYTVSRPAYNEPANLVTRENSIVNRLINLLDFLANQSATAQNPQPGHWRQFLQAAQNSPYVATHLGNVYPDWSKVVISGHSQGGGMAAMLAMNLPQNSPVRRVIMFASPNDTTGDTQGNQASPWIRKPSATPLRHYWGLRHADDINLGAWVGQNWQRLGGSLSGGVGGFGNGDEVDIGNGSINPGGAQRLVLTQTLASSADAHSSTVDRSILPSVVNAWAYLFTANGQD